MGDLVDKSTSESTTEPVSSTNISNEKTCSVCGGTEFCSGCGACNNCYGGGGGGHCNSCDSD